MLERLGIAEEAARRRALYPQHRYIAPHDRLPPAKPAPAPVVAPVLAVRLAKPIRKRGVSGGNGGILPPAVAIRINDVLHVVAAAFGVTINDMVDAGHTRRAAYPRFAAMHLMANVLRLSTSTMGDALGGRDHTTCTAGLRRAAELRRRDPVFAGRSRIAARALRQRWAARHRASEVKQ